MPANPNPLVREPGRDLRLGIVGLGAWGARLRETIDRLPGMELIAAATRTSPRQSGLPERVRLHYDWRQMLDQEKLDGVLVAVPPAVQEEIALAAIAAGTPVFLEKPLALSERVAWRIADAAEVANAIAVVDHIHLFSKPFRRLLELVKEAGSDVRMTSVAGNRGPFRAALPPLWDWGAHDVAMAIAIAGSAPNQIGARLIEERRINGDTGFRYGLDLEFPNGAAASIEVGNGMERKVRRFQVATQELSLVYEEMDEVLPHLVGQDGHCVADSGGAKPLDCSVAFFGERIRAGLPAFDQVILAAHTVAALAAADRLIHGGK